MRILLTDSRNHQFANVNSWELANVATKAVFKKQYWSDIYYHILFDDGEEISGSIDLEPASFHKPHQKEIFTWHLRTFWTNISKLTPEKLFSMTMEDVEDCKKLLTYLPNY